MYKEDSIETKKGDYAENIVKEVLRKKGYQFFLPENDGNGHLIDAKAIRHISRDKTNKQKETLREFNYDVKAKEKLIKYNATGVDQVANKHYLELAENSTTYVFFADASTGTIYGGDIKELNMPYTSTTEGVYPKYFNNTPTGDLIMFPIDKMFKLATLTQEQVDFLYSSTSINPKYKKL